MNITACTSLYLNISLIFDSKIGDVIEGNGKGNLSMTVNPTEDFKMFGTYEIDEGNYLFTMQNLINKRFTIDKGGYVRWNGDPYDATIKIDVSPDNYTFLITPQNNNSEIYQEG